MKYLFTFFIIPLLLLNTTTKKEDFIGKWAGEDQNQIGYITVLYKISCVVKQRI
ncbi:hypothetical protein [Winogradskyella pacifica]|uniref:hypothetical protein n=1 Tax=Winogradskyella pacifica TaxID=664642 RepID=UPI0015CE7E37|nr:hypothetical protein [Winogradskyella pacifica]